jgi:hypothetical protein
MKSAGLLAALTLWSCLPARASTAGDTYFVIVFGSEHPVIKAPRYSHTFATFIHLTPDRRIEEFTISWLPLNGDIRPLCPAPEVGRNFTLVETLRLSEENGLVVARWGPYQIDPDLWNRAVLQKQRLESGQVLYRAFDGGSPTGEVSNCQHAVSFMARDPRDRRTWILVFPASWGQSGSYWVALTLRPWYVEPCRTHDWLIPYLGLNPEAFIQNGLDRNPSPNPATRVIQASLHAQLLPNRVDCGR